MATRLTSLPQDEVQKRMVYACRLLQAGRGLTPAQVVETDQFYDDVILNGLCGGWVVVHHHDPDWLEGVWQALVDWSFAGSRTAPQQADLDDLRRELRANRVGFIVNEEVHDVPCLVTTAWQIMRKLEPTAGYGDVPSWLARVGGDRTYDDRAPVKEFDVRSPVKAAGPAVSAAIVKQTGFTSKPGKAQKHQFAHIESDHHHMGVHMEWSAKGSRIRVSESERTGVVGNCSPDELGSILGRGCTVGYSDGQLDSTATYSVRLYDC